MPLHNAESREKNGVWRPICDPNAGYAYSLSDAISNLVANHRDAFLPVDDGTMIIGSDYSGQHKGAKHEAYSFLVTTLQAITDWEPARQAVRSHWLRDERRMSFKQLRDSVRWKALVPFLNCAFMLRGNLVTVLVDRRITTWVDGGVAALITEVPEAFPSDVKSGSAEKIYTLSTLIAMLISGLRREDQPSIWISDHDETLDSHDRRESIAYLSSLLTFGFTRWRKPAPMSFGTTEMQHAPPWAEDFTAIPDLIAGAFATMAADLPAFFRTTQWSATLNPEKIQDRRAKAIAEWLRHPKNPMKHNLLRLECDGETVRASAQQFKTAINPD